MLVDVIQGTEEWHQARAGKITASHLSDVFAQVKSGEAASVKKYRARLMQERVTGQAVIEDWQSAAMRHGTETEPIAREEYELTTGNYVEQTGFWVHDEMDFLGASPDGLIGDDGALEVKCPETHTHLATWKSGTIPRDYLLQIYGVLFVTGRKWCDFVSFDNRLRWESLWMFRKRVTIEELGEMFPDFENTIVEFENSVRKEFEFFDHLAWEVG